MDPLIWIALGLGTGLIAPLLGGEGTGLFGDLLFGLLGAFLGGWLADAAYPASLATSAVVAVAVAVLGVLAFRRIAHAAPPVERSA
jgi:uncharacterized membrane protein YeaQ/YmgE (transglycosylase-associated protein family)